MSIPENANFPNHWRGDSFGPIYFPITNEELDLTGVVAEMAFRQDYDEGEIVLYLTSDSDPAEGKTYGMTVSDAERRVEVWKFHPPTSGDIYWDIQLIFPADANGHQYTQTLYAGVWEITQDRTPN